MVSQQTTIINPLGLHARPATLFVRCAGRFQSDIQISRAGAAPVNAKSIVRLMSQGFVQGTEVTITADGADEQEALDALLELLASGCGEQIEG